jgi:hypothetical protein
VLSGVSGAGLWMDEQRTLGAMTRRETGCLVDREAICRDDGSFIWFDGLMLMGSKHWWMTSQLTCAMTDRGSQQLNSR